MTHHKDDLPTLEARVREARDNVKLGGTLTVSTDMNAQTTNIHAEIVGADELIAAAEALGAAREWGRIKALAERFLAGEDDKFWAAIDAPEAQA